MIFNVSETEFLNRAGEEDLVQADKMALGSKTSSSVEIVPAISSHFC